MKNKFEGQQRKYLEHKERSILATTKTEPERNRKLDGETAANAAYYVS